ncbi:MAG: Gfo/Idh/MocA family oxidoreductase [Victivallales bacterium]|nr:Gfo/Idh/MocA family oxidoreductase [Victivallales bacterium]
MSTSKQYINVAVIAAGGRSCSVTGNLLRNSEGKVKIAAVYDPDKKQCQRARELWHSPDTLICGSYQEAINTPGVDWIMVFSPNVYHKEHILAGFAAGKNVFSEKPLATSIEDCQEIFTAYEKSGLTFATGFVLRYSPMYRKAKELLASGKLGRILSINADENIAPAHGGYIMMNWRRLSALAGPHILEKCCHDLDLLNWYCESLPTKAASFAGLDYFTPKYKHHMDKYGKNTYASWPDPHRVDCPFTADKDLMDNQVGILQYRNGIRVMFQATMSNAIPERRMYFSCTEGTLTVELYSGILRYKGIGDEGETVINYGSDGHGGGDNYIMKELYETMSQRAVPKCSGNEGLESAVVALALDKAAGTNTIIDLEPIWKKLGR